MTEAPNRSPQPASPEWLAQPYAERRVLAGFLKAGEVEIVYPRSNDWPAEVTARVVALLGAAASLSRRAEAGICGIATIDEPEALSVLDPVGRAIAAPAAVPFSYAWVQIKNLIAPAVIADPFPPPLLLTNEDVPAIADYSLYGTMGQPVLLGNGTLTTSAPLNVAPLDATMTGNHLLVRYQVTKVVKPIIVGYEQGRCYLLKEYGRVLYALSQGIERLLCLVYYGLDLSSRDMNARGIVERGDILNHLGQTRLASAAPPLVADFLNSSLAAVIPCRASLFVYQPLVQSVGIEFNASPQAGLPLNGGI